MSNYRPPRSKEVVRRAPKRGVDATRTRAGARGDGAGAKRTAGNVARSLAEQRDVRSLLRDFWREGFRLLPIQPAGKIPIGGYSSKVHFETWGDIDQFLKRHPDANFAAATGRASGFFVIDLVP